MREWRSVFAFRPLSHFATLPLFVYSLCHFATLPLFADELPVPPETTMVSPPNALMMGSQPVKATALRTRLSAEQARAFYEKALPKNGWTIQEAPWLQRAVQERDATREKLAAQPELSKDPRAAATLSDENFQRFQMAARQQLYAERDRERLFIGFASSGNQTMLAITRWEGDRNNPAGLDPSAPAPAWPAANPCCEGQEVPAALRQTPASIPAYPAGRLISTGASPAAVGRQTVSEMYLTADAADAVKAYYRQQMAYNGWTEESSDRRSDSQVAQMLGAQATQFGWDTLTFRNDRGMCLIVLTEYHPTDQEAASGSPSPLALLTAPSPEGQAGTTERTLIGITYLEGAALSRRATEQP